MTMFGWDDAGGGTTIPRETAYELARRGHDVTVFYAATEPLAGAGRNAIRERSVGGVRLVGVHNRRSVLLDIGHPRREIEDPEITAAFGSLLDEVRPDEVLFHNLHNLGVALTGETAARGIRATFTPHNFWLLCSRNHLLRPGPALCDGPADRGAVCASCTGSGAVIDHEGRTSELREQVSLNVETITCVSATVRDVLEGAGFPAAMLDVAPVAPPTAASIWEAVGRDRTPSRSTPLRVGFIGSLQSFKGAAVLAAAASLARAEVLVDIHGAGDEEARRAILREGEGRVRLAGAYRTADLPQILASIDVAVVPSLVWETAGLTVLECLAARVPVIVPRLGGLVESITDGVNGLVCEAWSAPAIAAALDRLAAEPGLLEHLQASIEAPRTFTAYVDDVERRWRDGAPAIRTRNELAVAWKGDQLRLSSLAAVNRAVCDGLERIAGIRLARRANDDPTARAPLPHPAHVEVRHQWPPDFTAVGAGRLALIQPWEFGSIPLGWRDAIRESVDEVWVPSEHVRRMYVDDGIDADRVHVVGNGVDLTLLTPEGPQHPLLPTRGVRFLYVGGTIYRKGVDVLVEAFKEAFGGGDAATLVVKDVGAASFYQGMSAGENIRQTPGLLYVDDDLTDEQMAALYRSCDVLVHPYRGEGFAMPVLEAMACGLPVIVSAGGPTDEFCPAEACWRIVTTRRAVPQGRIGMETVQEPWMLEPDADDLVRLFRAVADDPAERARRGAAGRAAALEHGWQAIADRYAERLHALARRPPLVRSRPVEPFPLPGARARNVLATPAWLGDDRLPELLRAWSEAFDVNDDVALFLLADPRRDGDADRWERHVMAAIDEAGVDPDRLADIAVLDHPCQGDDARRIHDACDAFVPLHAACAGHARLARLVIEPDARTLKLVPVRAENDTDTVVKVRI